MPHLADPDNALLILLLYHLFEQAGTGVACSLRNIVQQKPPRSILTLTSRCGGWERQYHLVVPLEDGEALDAYFPLGWLSKGVVIHLRHPFQPYAV